MSGPIVLDCVQGGPEWHRARLGVVTASAATQILTPAKLTVSKQRGGYLNRLLHEWVTGTSAEEFRGTKWTEHGHEYEGEALAALSLIADIDARSVGLVYRDDTRLTACSPDAIAEDATIEIKCPAGWTHIEWLRGGSVVPPKHVPQVQYQLWVTGKPRAFFVSYAAPLSDEPWLPGTSMAPLIVEVEPDPRWQDALSEHVPTFVLEMLAARAELVEMGVTPPAPVT